MTTDYFYEGSTLIAQTFGTHEMFFHYDGSGTATGFTYDDTDYYYNVNSRGDVKGIYDETGELVCEYSYDAWGRVISVVGSAAGTIGAVNPIRYRGYYYDGKTGLYYLQSRYYDAEVGRLINVDNQLSIGSDFTEIIGLPTVAIIQLCVLIRLVTHGGIG